MIQLEQQTYDRLVAAAKQVPELRKQLEESDREFDKIADVVIKLACAFGLGTADRTGIRPDILSGEEEPMRPVMKKLGDLMLTAAQAKVSAKAKAQLENEFSFFVNLKTVLAYYEQRRAKRIA
jgi:hypothetical protein